MIVKKLPLQPVNIISLGWLNIRYVTFKKFLDLRVVPEPITENYGQA